MKFKFTKVFFTNICLLFGISITSMIFGNPTFGTTDDNNLSGFISGSYTGNSEERLIFIQPVLAKLFHYIQLIFPSIEIYSWVLLIITILSLSFLLSIIAYKEEFKSIFNILMYLSVLPLLIWFTISPTYTAAALITALCSLLSHVLIISCFMESKVMYIFSILLMTFAFLLRPESFIGILILLAPFYFYYIFYLKNFNKKFFYYFILSFAWFFFILLINIQLQNVQNKNWAQYDKWNQMRHEMQHRKSEKYLIELAQNNTWSIPEYHLFMDLSFGDPKFFNINWIEKGYNHTASKRSILKTENYNLIEILNGASTILKQYYGLIIFQVVSFIVILSLINLKLKQSLTIIFIGWSSLLISLVYIIVFLHLTERVMLVILSSPIFILVTLLKISNVKYNEHKLYTIITLTLIPFILYLVQPWGVYNQYNENIKKKQFDQQTAIELLEFNDKAIYVGPGVTELFDSNNPYFQSSFETLPKYITAGSWDTFSPHWENRKNLLGIKEESIYDSLLGKDIFWASFGTPDTAYLIELFLEEKKGVDIWREEILNTSTGLKIFRYGITK